MTTTADALVTLTFKERLLIALGRAWPTHLRAAEYLEVDRTTITRWTRGVTVPSPAVLRVIASEADLPYEWLKPSPDESGKGSSRYAPWDLNPEPTDSYTCLVIGVLSEAEAILRGLVTA